MSRRRDGEGSVDPYLEVYRPMQARRIATRRQAIDFVRMAVASQLASPRSTWAWHRRRWLLTPIDIRRLLDAFGSPEPGEPNAGPSAAGTDALPTDPGRVSR